jgi:SAM-dependent methyltransferase
MLNVEPSYHGHNVSSEDKREKPLEACDLCGSVESFHLVDASPKRCRLVVCSECALIYASPQLSGASLDVHYDTVFESPGTKLRAPSGLALEEDVRYEEKHVANWGAKIVHRFVEVEGKNILDLRCHSGALSVALKAKGANVISVDPFEANANYCKRVRGLSNVFVLPFSRFSDLALPVHEQFDIVTGLIDHVLGHLLSPRIFLARVFEFLKPGGYLFLVEKDVLLPSWLPDYEIKFVFDSGPAHQYHLTRETTTRYLLAAGFEIVECNIDDQSMTSFRHVLAIARKPYNRLVSPRGFEAVVNAPTAEAVRRRVKWLQRTWRLHRARLPVERRLKRVGDLWRGLLAH